MLATGYGFTDPSVTLGAAMEGKTIHQEPKIRIPLAMMNRHGLIAGATGTGKTRTLQLLTDQLSAQGVPVFVADMKGDLSGLADARRRERSRDGPCDGGRVELEAGRGARRVRQSHGRSRRSASGHRELVRADASR